MESSWGLSQLSVIRPWLTVATNPVGFCGLDAGLAVAEGGVPGAVRGLGLGVTVGVGVGLGVGVSAGVGVEIGAVFGAGITVGIAAGPPLGSGSEAGFDARFGPGVAGVEAAPGAGDVSGACAVETGLGVRDRSSPGAGVEAGLGAGACPVVSVVVTVGVGWGVGSREGTASGIGAMVEPEVCASAGAAAGTVAVLTAGPMSRIAVGGADWHPTSSGTRSNAAITRHATVRPMANRITGPSLVLLVGWGSCPDSEADPVEPPTCPAPHYHFQHTA